ncbi:tryptophan-rich sensory protein [Christiangramia aquimixticola]|uniref:tryptophan-rich sensory protein n=1 Tax=Christiangramia aquimixticola TaxID=1697558 RepID=UPI003AA91650
MFKKLALFNFLSVILTIAVNFFAQTGKINDTTIGEMSAKYANLFTPAGYAFSIWGVIYLGLLALTGFMLHQAFTREKRTDFIKNTSGWLISANLSSCVWVATWLYDLPGISVLFMFLILFSLCMVIIKNKMEIWDAPLAVIAFYWWPICFYSGWITVASIANVAAWLTSLGWNGAIFSAQQWTIIMIIIATVINGLMIYYRNMREFALVGVWALVAIYSKHTDANPEIAYTALSAAFFLFIYVSYHGFKNRKTNPLSQLLK